MDKRKSKGYINLTNQIPDLEEHIKRDEVKVVPIPKNSKAPNLKKWNTRKYTLEEIQTHKYNFGILIGYGNSNNGYSIGCIDIDGLTIETDDEEKQAEIKQRTKELIYEDLKDLPNCLQVLTQSKGYHIYFWTKKTLKSTSKTSNSLYFPKNFKISELAGKCLDNAIEIFTKQERKQCVLPSSTIYNKATNEIREYKVISTLNKLSDIEVLDDLNQTVINHLTSKGYTYNETKTDTSSTSTKRRIRKKHSSNNDNSKLRKLDKKELTQLVKLLAPVFKKELHQLNKKHDGAMYLGGYFSYHINKASAVKIVNGIVKQVGTVFKDSQAFRYTVLQNYDTETKEKGGLPKLCNLLSTAKKFNVSKFSDELNKICNQSFTKELVSDIIINDNQVPIYLYEDEYTKWLKYEEFLPKTDLILNLNTYIGQFTDTKTEKEITSFKFKFENKYFNLSNPEKNNIKGMLEPKELKLPKYFTEMVRTSINNLDKYMLAPKELSKESILKSLFITRTKESYARKELGKYLHENGTILRRGINKPYILNEKTNGYDSVETDDILEFLYNTGDFELNSIHTDDITKALGFISERVKPTYNIVKFPNCLYDIENFTVIESTDEPILTLTEVQYNYNPEAKGKLIVEFLETSLKQPDDTPEEIQERVQAVYEFIGYLLTSGNKKFAWFIITGIGGAGKGVFTRLIISIFGTDKVGDLKLQELTPDNKFATAHLENKQINIVRDSPKKPIEDTGMLKAITGYDDIGIEHKGQDKYILPKEEVPDMVTVCNNVPIFKEGFDESLLQRAIIFEFLNKFRNTDDENKTLEDDILNNPEEMEYLLYQSIQAYKEMVQNGNDFKARISEAKTMELLGKHTDPISYILPKLVRFNMNAEDDKEEPIPTTELNRLIIYLGKKFGLNITGLNKDGLIKPNTLINKIRYEFNLDNDYKTTSKPIQNPENNYKWESTRIYPYLMKTPEYDNYLKEMEDDEEE